jgi:hypothetical protein
VAEPRLLLHQRLLKPLRLKRLWKKHLPLRPLLRKHLLLKPLLKKHLPLRPLLRKHLSLRPLPKKHLLLRKPVTTQKKRRRTNPLLTNDNETGGCETSRFVLCLFTR